MDDLRIEPCRSECTWRATDKQLDGEQLFACGSCGSEWVPSQPWTPADADGIVPPDVARVRQGR
ncbi:hypothetical protein [Calidifontibacter indicus]|uniref:hypothetical protein n=1 Tax=Calidifontibacter indicus TaxID=419650 RepID=UPI003D7392D0